MSEVRIYNKILCPSLWHNFRLDKEVRISLLQIAKDFYEKTRFKAPVKDICLMGSAANYNWTPESDVDVHILIDFNQLRMPEDTAEKVVKTTATQWNMEHDIRVKGHKVEINFQNISDTKLHVTGIYSLLKNKWVRIPKRELPKINKVAIISKYTKLKDYIEKAIQSGERNYMRSVKEYIDAYRQYGLDSKGELSVENITFKLLRSRGILKKLKEAINKTYDQQMSVDETSKVKIAAYGDYNETISEGKFTDQIWLGWVDPDNHQIFGGRGEDYQTHDQLANIDHKYVFQLEWEDAPKWRYRKDLNVVYWWSRIPDKDIQNSLNFWIKKHTGGVSPKHIRLRNISTDERDIKAVSQSHGTMEGYGAGKPEDDRLHLPGHRWQIKSKNAPKTPKMYNIQEMPQMTLKGKKAYADDVPLKTMPVEKVKENIVVFRNPHESFIGPAGVSYVYFMDSKESASDMADNKIPMLMIPRGTFYSGGSPITDVWKKRFQKPGTEHILGLIEGISNDDIIYIDMISVRPGWQRNRIASLMMDMLKDMFPNAKVQTSSTTDKGEKFFKKEPKLDNPTDEAFDPTSVGPRPEATEGQPQDSNFYHVQNSIMRKM